MLGGGISKNTICFIFDENQRLEDRRISHHKWIQHFLYKRL